MNHVTCVGMFFLRSFPRNQLAGQVHCAILDGRYLVASRSLFYISICVFDPLCQCAICSLPWVEVLWVKSLHAQSGDPMDQRQIDCDASV
jgi:hypothetical protein